MTEHIGSEYVEVLPDAHDFARRFQEQTAAGMTEAGRKAGNDWQRGFAAATLRGPQPTIRPDVNDAPARAKLAALRKEADSTQHGLMGALIALAPAVVPLAGAATLGAGALVEMGIAGIAAVKGVSTEMRLGTAMGLDYAAGIKTVKTDFAELAHTAASGVLKPFEQTIARLHAAMPAFNADIGRSSAVLGDTAGHLANAAIAGEHTFAPALLMVEHSVDRVAAKFDAWASGPGGAKFADTLANDWQHVAPVIDDLASGISHLIAAADTPGLGIVGELGVLARVLDAIPTPVLSVLITGLTSLKIAGLVTGLMDKLALSITRVAVAEEEGAVASSTFRSRLGAGVGLVGKLGAGLLVAGIATTSLADATESWRTSTDATKNIMYNIGQTAKDLFSLNWGNLGHDIVGLPAEEQARNAHLRSLQSALYNSGLGLAGAGGSSFFEQALAKSGGSFDANASAAADRAKIADLGNRLGPLRAIMDQTTASTAKLRGEQTRLAEAGLSGSKAYAEVNRELLATTARGDQAANTYQHLLARITTVSQELQAYQRAQHVFRETALGSADRYAQQQQTRIGEAHVGVFAQNPTITAGAQAVASYQAQVEKAIKSEESWTKTSGEQVVHFKLAGEAYTFSRKSMDAAMAATGNDAAKAAGLLVGHQRALVADSQAAQQAAVESGRLSGAVGAAEAALATGSARHAAGSAAAATADKVSAEQLNTYAAVVGITSQMLAEGTVSQDNFVRAMLDVQGVVDDGSTAMQSWVAAVQAYTSATDTAATRGQLLGAAMVALNGDTLAYQDTMAGAATANQQFVTDFNAANKAVVNLKRGTIDYHNAGAKPLLDDLLQMQSATQQAASATYQHEVAMGRSKQAALDAADVYYNDTRNALISEHDQLGITRGEASKLADTYFHWPKDAKTQVALLGGDTTQSFLKGILEDLDKISGNHHAILNVDAYFNPAAQKYMDSQGVVRQHTDSSGNNRGNTGGGATGMRVNVGTTGTADDVLVRVSKGEWIINAAQSEKHNDLLTAINYGTHGFAAGGHGPGEHGGFTGVTPHGGANVGNGSGSDTSASDKAKAAADKEEARLKAARQAARSDIDAFLSALGITTNAITAAEHTLMDALKKAKVSTDELAKISKESHRLAALTADIATETQRISKAQSHLQDVQQSRTAVRQAAQQEAATVQAAIMGLFDVSQAGVQQQVYRDKPAGPVTARSFLTSLTGSADTAVKTQGELEQLKGHIPDALYKELAGNPGSDQAQIDALAGASPKLLHEIEAQFARLHKAAKGTGHSVMEELFGGKLDAAGHRVDVAKGLLNGVDPAKNPELAKSVRHLANQLFGAGKETAHGLKVGLTDELRGDKQALRRLGHDLAAEIRDDLAGRTPRHHRRHHPGRGGGGSGNNSSDVQVVFNGPVNDPQQVTNKVRYALARASRRGRH